MPWQIAKVRYVKNLSDGTGRQMVQFDAIPDVHIMGPGHHLAEGDLVTAHLVTPPGALVAKITEVERLVTWRD